MGPTGKASSLRQGFAIKRHDCDTATHLWALCANSCSHGAAFLSAVRRSNGGSDRSADKIADGYTDHGANAGAHTTADHSAHT